jgi:Right handed beta helix region
MTATRQASRSRVARALAALAALGLAAWLVSAALQSGHGHKPSPLSSAARCNQRVSPSTFASAVAASAAGQTLCLEAGDYGVWHGIDRTVTIRADRGTAPTMKISFGAGASGFTLTGISGMGGQITAGASDITIRDSTFTSTLDIEGATHHIVLDHNRHNWMVGPSGGGANAKIFVDVTGTLASPAVTIENSDIENGDLDGVHIGGGSGLVVLHNTFRNLCDMHANHTDNIQFEGGTQIRVAGNYMYAQHGCSTQGITSFDGGTGGVIIEDNVVDIPRDWGIELYSDKNSIVRHNTVVYHPKAYSEFGNGTGQIDVDRKSQDPAGTGTRVYDNIAFAGFANGSSGTAYDNVSPEQATYVGPATAWSGFRLQAGSPVGIRAASDGSNAGARIPAR